jgi:hypothetical protein
LGFKFDLEPDNKLYRKIGCQKITFWGIIILPPVIDPRAELSELPDCLFVREMRGNFCALNSILRPAINSTGKLHPKKITFLGHNHLTSSNSPKGGTIRVAKNRIKSDYSNRI